jgi:probable F420-dependent oxidoreductase
MVLFGFMAAATRSIGLVTGILILPQRQTALVAKQAATLDLLSGGRLRLGVAVGWNPVEFVGLGQDFHVRGRRIEAQVELLRQLWTEPLVKHRDEWHDVPDAGLNPLPVQRPIPIWFGGHADAVLRRIARMGDGWLPNYASAEDAAPHLSKLDGYLAEAGRTRADLGIEPRLSYGDGDPAVWRPILDGWASAGATHMTLNTMGCGFDTAKQHVGAIRRFAEHVL